MRILRKLAAELSMIQRLRPGLPHDNTFRVLSKQPHTFNHQFKMLGKSTTRITSIVAINHRKLRIFFSQGPSIVYSHPDIGCIVEYIKNKLYFATLANGRREARNTTDIHLFNTDNEFVYNNFYNDFGPLNLACLYR